MSLKCSRVTLQCANHFWSLGKVLWGKGALAITGSFKPRNTLSEQTSKLHRNFCSEGAKLQKPVQENMRKQRVQKALKVLVLTLVQLTFHFKLFFKFHMHYSTALTNNEECELLGSSKSRQQAHESKPRKSPCLSMSHMYICGTNVTAAKLFVTELHVRWAAGLWTFLTTRGSCSPAFIHGHANAPRNSRLSAAPKPRHAAWCRSAELGPRITFMLTLKRGFAKVKAVDVFLWLSCLSCLFSFSSKQRIMAGCPYMLQIILSVLHPDTTRDNLWWPNIEKLASYWLLNV